jgi:DNA helicase-2/ATP-dependent DNA helicase PcrA
LTLHAAKGLEFDQVFIIGLDDGTLPHSRSFDDDEELSEERRLFYVGITRTRNMLYLVRAQRRSLYGSYEPQIPSRFLIDVPADLVIEDPSSGYSSFGFSDQRRGRISRWENNRSDSYFEDWDADKSAGKRGARDVYNWERMQSQRNKGRSSLGSYAAISPEQADAPLKPRKREATYKVGMQVRHSVFGEGLILNVLLEGDGEETLEIFFSGIKEKKKLAASFASLEIIH